MGKKSRKKKKQEKEKESDGSTGNVNVGSNSSNNNNNNNNNNDITIPTVATTTTAAIVLTTRQLDVIDNSYQLAGYPKSQIFTIAFGLWRAKRKDLAVDAFKRGADNEGCVPCMCCYVSFQYQRGNLYLLLPYAFEGAIRGNTYCMNRLINCYDMSKPAMSSALLSLWAKMKIELGDTEYTEEKRKEIKKDNANFCCICSKKESEDNDVTLVKCSICKYYSYCGKDCQTYHWKVEKHMNECRQVILLRKYCKPQYVKEIREAIIGGQDPKDIHTLQRLRMKLGLNRPKEEYEELLLHLANDDTNDTTRSPNRYEYLVGRKDGTVHIGSTPNVI